MPATVTTPPRVQHAADKPTGRQIYRLCADLLRIAGEPFPANRGDASELIERIAAQAAAITAATAPVAAQEDPGYAQF